MALVAGLGAAGIVGGSVLEAGAAKDAAEAQGKILSEKFAFLEGELKKARELAAPTEGELQNLDQLQKNSTAQLANELRDIQRLESLVEATDPSIKEAGQQQLQLLKGQEAAALAPVRSERQRARQQFIDNLRDRGVEVDSSAGIEALSRFDAQSALLFSNVQRQALQDVSGIVATGFQTRPQVAEAFGRAFQRQAQTLGTLLGARGNIQQRQINPILGLAPSLAGFAGGGEFGALGAAQAKATFGQALGALGSQAFGAGLQSSLPKSAAVPDANKAKTGEV